MSEALSGLSGTVCLMDDILVHGTEHDKRLRLVLQRLSNLGMTLNSEKCAVEFLGHVIDSQTRSKQSLCHRRICRFLGMVNQLTKPRKSLSQRESCW